MKNSAYWKKRYEQLEKASYQKGVEFYQKLDDQYVNATSQIDKEIRAWYQRFATNNNVSITEAKKMLDKEELKELKWTINEYIKYGEENAIDGRFMKQLENASARYHISRLEALKLNTQNVIEKLYGNQTDEISDFIKDIYTDNMFHSMYELQKGFNIGWNFSGIDEKKLDKLISIPWAVDGVNFSDRIWQNKTKLLNELSNELTSMCLTGKSPDTAIKNISKKLNVAKSRAKSIVYTESSHFQSQSDRDTLKEFGCEKYEILATLDSHTSEICQEMDGKIFDLSDFETGVSAPPFHPYCRTVIVPAFDDDFDVGERAARDKESGKTYFVPDDITYPEWKKAFVDGEHEGYAEFTKEGKKHFEKETTNGMIEVEDKIKSIDDCTTVEEVEDLFRTHDDWFYTKTMNNEVYKSIDGLSLKKIDLECSKSIYTTYQTLFDKYPQLKGKLNSINSSNLGGGTYAQCMMGLGHGGIAINTKYFNDVEKLKELYKRDLANNFHPLGTDYTSIVMHELGHAIDDYLTYVEIAGGVINGWKPKLVSSYLRPKVMKACGLKISDIAKNVSIYATQDAQEWFAECFAEYMCSKNPRVVAMEFGKQLEELLKGVK